MSIYKIATEVTLTGPYLQQLAALSSALSKIDKETRGLNTNLGRIKLGKSATDGIEKLSKELRGLTGIATKVSTGINADFRKAFSGVTHEAGTVKTAIHSWGNEVSGVERRVGDLLGKMRGAAGISFGGAGRGGIYNRAGHVGGGVLDTVAMGPQHNGVFAGLNVQHATTGLLDASGELQRQVNLYRLGGAAPSDVLAGRNAAFRSATQVPDVGVAEQMKLLRELSGATGDEAGARTVLPDAAKAMSIMGAVAGRKSEEDMKRLFKFIELRGVAIDENTHKIDPEKFNSELTYATKAMVAAQGLVTSSDMLQFAKQAGPMAKGMSGDQLFATFLASMEDMGGSRSGTSLTAVGRQFLGGIMTGGKVGRLDELGLLNKAGVDRSDPDKLKITDPTKAIKGYEVLTDPTQGFGAFVEKILRPAMQSHGITDRQKQNEELYRSIGTDTARRQIGLFLSGKEQVEMVADRYKKAMGGAEGYDKIFGAGQDFQTSSKALGESIHTLKTALGDASGIAPMMMSLAKAVTGFADTVKDSPALASTATLGGVGASAALLGYGGLKTVTGFGLPAAATQLSAAAVALEGAAAKLGGGDVAKDVAKNAAPGGLLAALGLTGITLGTAAGGAFAAYATAKTMPKVAAEKGATGIDPATGGGMDANPMGGMGPSRPYLQDWWKKNAPTFLGGAANEAGKGAALEVLSGFKTASFNPEGTAAGSAITAGFKSADFAGAGAAAGAAAASALSSALSKVSLSVPTGAIQAASLRTAGTTAPRGAGRSPTVTSVSAPVPTAGPPPARPQIVQVNSTLNMDGRRVAAGVTRHQVADAHHPRSTGGMDGHGQWRPPGTLTTDAA